jgi:hypothetical protein
MDFVVLYSGKTLNEARLVAVSHDPALVRVVAEVALSETRIPRDPVTAPLERGRRESLKVMRRAK